MKAVVFSDTHFSDRTDSTHREIFRETMLRVAQKELPDYLIIVGDFLDKTICSPQLFKFLTESFQPLIDNTVPVIILIGDHEQGNPGQVSPLVYFSKLPRFHIIEKATGIKLGNKSCLFLPPDTKDLKSLNSDYSAIFYHGFLQNAKVSRNYRMYSKSLFDIEDFLQADAEFYFFGGVHRRQNFEVPEGVSFCGYLGSFWQLNFGEEGNPTGYLIWDSGEIRFVDVESPRFKTVQFKGKLFEVIEQFKNLELPEGSYHLKILLDSNFSNEDLMILRKVGEKKNLASLHFEIKPQEEKVIKRTEKISVEDSPISILEEWLKRKEMKEEKRKIILKRATELKKNLRVQSSGVTF